MCVFSQIPAAAVFLQLLYCRCCLAGVAVVAAVSDGSDMELPSQSTLQSMADYDDDCVSLPGRSPQRGGGVTPALSSPRYGAVSPATDVSAPSYVGGSAFVFAGGGGGGGGGGAVSYAPRALPVVAGKDKDQLDSLLMDFVNGRL